MTIILFSCSTPESSNSKKITNSDHIIIEDFIIVPDLSGKTETEAKQLLFKKGLEIQIDGEESNSRISKGKICSQSPSTNSTAISGTKIIVRISSGPIKN